MVIVRQTLYKEENKMGIDNDTQVKYFNIVIDDNKQYLEQMRKKADEDGQNDEDKKLSLSSDLHSFSSLITFIFLIMYLKSLIKSFALV